MKPLVGVVQMCSTNDKEDNLRQITSLVEKAHKRGAKMVFLPENCDYMGINTKETIAMAEAIGDGANDGGNSGGSGGFVGKCRDLCKNYDMWMSVGSVHNKVEAKKLSSQQLNKTQPPTQQPQQNSIQQTPTQQQPTQKQPTQQQPSYQPDKILNTQLIINNEGCIVSTYNKVHLFDITSPVPIKESSYTLIGSKIRPPVPTPVGNIGMAICYDMRFPEHSMSLRLLGADVINFPSAFTVPTGMAHWEVLLRARAIETQCYIVASAQVGKHNEKRSSYGHAMLIDPWGTIRGQCQSAKADVCFGEIDLNLVSKLRQNMPVVEHRRSDLYGDLIGSSVQLVPINHHPLYDFGGYPVPSSCVIFSTPLSFTFVNKSPLLSGHILVSPIRKTARLRELTVDEIKDLYACVQLISGPLEELYNASSLTISTQDGVDAGQTVQHVHVHVLPRKAGDFKENDDVYDKLEKHDKAGRERVTREIGEMEGECVVIREALRKAGVDVCM